MIERLETIKGTLEFVLDCDACGDLAPESFEDMLSVVNYINNNKWEMQKENGKLKHICHECIEIMKMNLP